MATDTVERQVAHVRSVTVTAICCLSGLVAGVVASAVAEGPSDMIGVWVLVAAILAQVPIYRLLEAAGLELDVDDFGPKDYLYVGFMTFALWFVSYSVLLSTGTTL